jgi:hypothetical protein
MAPCSGVTFYLLQGKGLITFVHGSTDFVQKATPTKVIFAVDRFI